MNMLSCMHAYLHQMRSIHYRMHLILSINMWYYRAMRRIYCGSWAPLEKSRHLLSSSLHLKKTLKAPSSVTNSPIYLWICCTTYSSGSSHPSADEGMIKRGWRKTASVVSAFMTGTKVIDPVSMQSLLVVYGWNAHD